MDRELSVSRLFPGTNGPICFMKNDVRMIIKLFYEVICAARCFKDPRSLRGTFSSNGPLIAPIDHVVTILTHLNKYITSCVNSFSGECQRWELDPRPAVYESAALTN